MLVGKEELRRDEEKIKMIEKQKWKIGLLEGMVVYEFFKEVQDGLNIIYRLNEKQVCYFN